MQWVAVVVGHMSGLEELAKIVERERREEASNTLKSNSSNSSPCSATLAIPSPTYLPVLFGQIYIKVGSGLRE